MSADPNPPSPQIVSGADKAAPAPAASRVATAGSLWIHRLTVLMFVCVCAGFGVLLVMLPWTSAWTDNRFFIIYPPLRDIAANNFVRGMCSGLGILDIWIGFSEALNYHEDHQA